MKHPSVVHVSIIDVAACLGLSAAPPPVSSTTMRPSQALWPVLWATRATPVLAAQPWLNKSLDVEVRLQSFIAQLNMTQKLAMVQGDTEASNPLSVSRST